MLCWCRPVPCRQASEQASMQNSPSEQASKHEIKQEQASKLAHKQIESKQACERGWGFIVYQVLQISTTFCWGVAPPWMIRTNNFLSQLLDQITANFSLVCIIFGIILPISCHISTYMPYNRGYMALPHICGYMTHLKNNSNIPKIMQTSWKWQ